MSYGHIKGELDLLEHPNTNDNYSLYEHIVEGGIEAHSGVLEILDCPTSTVALKLRVIPGNHMVRIYLSNLSSSDLDEDNHYSKIEVWPDNSMERKVLKRHILK